MSINITSLRETTPRLHIFARRPSDNARAIRLVMARIEELEALQAACHILTRAERIDELQLTLATLRRTYG